MCKLTKNSLRDVNIAFANEVLMICDEQSINVSELIRTDREVNDGKPYWVLECVQRQVVNCLMSGNNACFGLTFKPYIDDLREGPAMQVTRMIAEWHQGSTLVVEPNVHQLLASLQQSVALVGLEDALRHVDVLVLLVDHPHFKAITPKAINQLWIVDTKGVW